MVNSGVLWRYRYSEEVFPVLSLTYGVCEKNEAVNTLDSTLGGYYMSSKLKVCLRSDEY